MAVAGLELPTGNMDHPFGHGRPGSIAAGLISLERRPIAMIAYTYLHKSGEYQGNRASGNVFAGGGAAWTPIDDEADYALPVWAGVIPVHVAFDSPIRDERCDRAIALPPYLQNFQR